MTELREKELVLGKSLGGGAFGTIHEVQNSVTLADGTSPRLAFKRYKDNAPLREESMRAARVCVDFRRRLSSPARAELDGFSAWPLAMVVDEGGETCGLVMALADGCFQGRLIDQNRLEGFALRVRRLDLLIVRPENLGRYDPDQPELDLVDRLTVLTETVRAIAWLHNHGWVFGDVSLANFAFSLTPPRVFLFDCDAAAPMEETNRLFQGHSPHFEPPEFQGRPDLLQSQQSDCYKLGLVAVRVLAPGGFASMNRDPETLRGLLPDEGVRLVARSLSPDPAQRPTAHELLTYLDSLVRVLTGPPTVTHASLSTRLCIRGQDAHVAWTIVGADSVVITAPNGVRVAVDPRQHPDGYSFTPAAGGPVTLLVKNRYAQETVQLGALHLCELPPFSLSVRDLPQVWMPSAPGPKLPSFKATLPPSPFSEVLDTASAAIISSIDISSELERIFPRDFIISPPNIGLAMADALQDVLDQIRKPLST